jgi:hypothetical protein
LGHFIEQFPGVADRGAFAIGFNGAVEEEGGWVRGEGEQVGFHLAGLYDGAVGGTETEELSVERERGKGSGNAKRMDAAFRMRPALR